MSLETDLLLDRRRLKRRLLFWRVATVLAVALCAVLVIGRGTNFSRAHLARVTVSGLITEDRKLTQSIADLAADKTVRGVLLVINSPGGSVAAGESLHDALERVAAKKPVVAVMGGLAASAGYMIAMPAERIFARESTLTGSIGVLLETGEASGLLARLGLNAETIVSGPLKDQPSFTHPMSPQGREVLRGLVMDMYDQFVGMVARGRHMDEAAVRALADGRAYTGRQALKLGLVDAIGGEEEARDWLTQTHHLSHDLPVEDVRSGTLAERTLGASLGEMLVEAVKVLTLQGVKLDGGWAVWQPAAERD